MNKISKTTKALFIGALFIGTLIGSLNTQPAQAFIFGSENKVAQWIKNASTIILRTETNDVRIGSGDGAIFVDTGSSRVGIATTTPQEALEVVGNIRNSALTASRLLSSDSSKNLVSVGNLTSWITEGAGLSVDDDGDGTVTINAAALYDIPLTASTTEWATAYGWGDHSTQNYLDLDTYPNTDTDSTDDLLDSDFSSAGLMKTDGAGTYSIITDSSTNWDTAYTHSQDNTQAHSDYLLNTGDTGTGDYILDGAVTINEAGADKDFRVETTDSANTFIVDGEKGTVGIGAPHPYKDKNAWKGTLYVRGSRAMDSYRGLLLGQSATAGAGVFNYVEALDDVFFGFTLWVNDLASRSDLYYGGIGWGGNDVQSHLFYTNPTYQNGSVGTKLRMKIDKDGYVYFPADNQYVYFGAGNDARMYYNNTDFIIDPDVIGTGKVLIGATGDDDLQAGNYFSGDGSQGITDTSSYWLCTASDCSTTCQVTIKDGLITGCP